MPAQFQANYYKTYLGLNLTETESVKDAMDSVFSSGCDFALVSLQSASSSDSKLIDIRYISGELMGSSVIGSIGTLHTDEEETKLQEIRTRIEWATHAGMHSIIIDSKTVSESTLTRIVTWFSVVFPPETSSTRLLLRLEETEWELWNRVRTICNYPQKLFLCLDVGSVAREGSERWLGEPVSIFAISKDSNVAQSSDFFLKLAQRNAHPLFSCSENIQTFVNILCRFPPLQEAESYVAPYHDSLQLPLQPLADHMDNTVYEIFEADRTKYALYEEAVFRSVDSLIKTHSLQNIRIAVVGAGRGGLIDACVHAIKRTQSVTLVFFDIIGVEKSPHAARTLSYKAKDDELWHALGARGSVSILHADMRGWTPDSPIDILVSELLGSLGDNEASPECLDSVMHVLHPERGVSIPSRYSSTLEPVSSHRIWTSAREGNKFETPLVVYFHSCFKPSSPLELFSFAHSTGKCRNASNQSKFLSWEISQDTTIHGFAGYFHAELFGGVVMSINPPTATEQMVSWFPAFLPIRTPIFVNAGETLSVRVDRVKTDVKVWIEWTVISPHCQATNNACGSTHSVGL